MCNECRTVAQCEEHAAHTIHTVQSLETVGKLCQVSNGIAPFAFKQTHSRTRGCLSDEERMARETTDGTCIRQQSQSTNQTVVVPFPSGQNLHDDPAFFVCKPSVGFRFQYIYLQWQTRASSSRTLASPISNSEQRAFHI